MSTVGVADDLKQEFENTSPSWLGVTVITGRHQDPKAIPVAPGTRVFLSREEQILTSRAHQRDEDSPFNNGLTPISNPGRVSEDRRVPYDEALVEPERSDAEIEAEPVGEITGTEPQPAGEGAAGVQAADEIAGTPEAQAKAKVTTPPPRAPRPATSPSPPKPVGTP